MKFDYTTTTQKDFGLAVSTIEGEVAKGGFRVLHIHDVQKTLSEKGFSIEPMKIVEFCNAKSAFAALQADIKIGLCLPCKILVYTKDGQSFISAMRPTVLSEFFPKAQLGALPKEIDTQIKKVIDDSR